MKIINRFFLPLAFSGVLCSTIQLSAQVKITDGADISMDPNSILELESADKGLLIPRIGLINKDNPAPLTAPVPEGMLVYSLSGGMADGFYYWTGSEWKLISSAVSRGMLTPLTRSTNDTLDAICSIVLASNDITLTLPQVNASDTSLQITIKNGGSHTDLITVRGYGSAKIDGMDNVRIRPGLGETFIPFGSSWIIQNRDAGSSEIIDIGPDEAFKSLPDVIDFLEEHMERPMVIRISGEETLLTETVVIDLPYSLTIQGISFGSGIIGPGTGLSGKPMFRCLSDCYFKMLQFDASTLPGYGSAPGEDALRLSGSDTYNEIKDCTFEGFYNSVTDSSNAELWLFECDILNSKANGLLIHSDETGVKVRISETDFINCSTGINLSKASGAIIQVISGFFENSAGNTGILYNPSEFSFQSLFITNNAWNQVGTGISGFDFTRTDARDSDAFIENNVGFEGNKPHCKINVTNNSSTVTCSTPGNWYKAVWTNTSHYTTNLKVENNKVTYLPSNGRDMMIIISGNVLVSSNNRVVTIGIVKGGNSAIRYGETTLRVTVANQPFQFSTVIHLEDVEKDDYFEMFCSSSGSGDVLTFQDINWFVSTE